MEIRSPLQQHQARTASGKSRLAALALRAGDQLTAAVLEVEKGRDALLAFGQFKAYARLPLPVVSGQDVQIRVEPSGQELRMVMVPKGQGEGMKPSAERLEIRMFEPVADRLTIAAHAGRLQAGTTLQGRITGFEKEGLKLVDFGSFKAFTKIDIPVRQGQIVPLTVLQSGREVALALDTQARPTAPAGLTPSADLLGTPQASSMPVPPNGMALSEPSIGTSGRSTAAFPVEPPTAQDIAVLRDQVNQLLEGAPRQALAGDPIDRSNPMKKVLANLQQILNPISPDSDMRTLVARVRAFVENSGVYFEKRLEQEIRNVQSRSGTLSPAELAEQPKIRNLMVADMKPNLLILNKFLETQNLDALGAGRHMLETMKSVVQRALAHIEQQQIGATEKPVDPEVLQVFSHLLLLAEDKIHTRLNVYYSRKGRDGEQKAPRVSLLLDMDPMGAVRSDLWMVAKDLNITFFVPDQNVQNLIQKEQHRIAEALQPAFNTVAVNVVVNAKKIEDFDGEDLSLPQKRQLDVSV